MRACFPAPEIAWLNLDRSHSPSRGIECPFLQARRSPELAKPSAGTEPTALRRPPDVPPDTLGAGPTVNEGVSPPTHGPTAPIMLSSPRLFYGAAM